MLKVTLHNAKPSRASDRNVLGRLDIGYAKLDARADYKAVMFIAGVGEQRPVQLLDYPRWSTSVWDLVTRVICQTLNGSEALALENFSSGRGAFIEDLTAVIEHWPDGVNTHRATIGTAHVQMRRRRCHYTATFEEDILGKRESSIFVHAPPGLTPWDLLARSYAWTVNERFELPPRPALYTPIPVPQGTASFVPLDTVSEPAFTGIQRWLQKRGLGTSVVDLVDGPCVTEARFVEFLSRAV